MYFPVKNVTNGIVSGGTRSVLGDLLQPPVKGINLTPNQLSYSPLIWDTTETSYTIRTSYFVS